MNFLRKLISSILVMAVTATVSVYIVSSTLLNSHYWQAQAQNSRLYTSAAQSLPTTLAPGDGPEAQATQQALSSLITSRYLEAKLTPFLDGLLKYYQGIGPAPRVDFSDLTAEANRQGLLVPSNSTLASPIAPANPAGLKAALSWISFLKIWGPIITLVLLGIVVALNHGWHRFLAIAKVCWAAAATQGLLFLLLKVAPGMMDSLIKSNATVSPLARVLANFFKVILAGAGSGFGWAAVGLTAMGLLVLVLGLIARAIGFVGRHGGHTGDERYARPKPDSRPTL